MKLNVQLLMFLAQSSLILAAPTIAGGVANDHTYARVEKTELINKLEALYSCRTKTVGDPFIANGKGRSDTAYADEMAVLEALKDCFRRVFPYGCIPQSPEVRPTAEQDTRIESNTGNVHVHAGLESIFPEAMDDIGEVNFDDMFPINSNLLGCEHCFISGDHDMDVSYEDSDTESSATDEICEEDKFLDSRQLCVLYSHLFRQEDLSL